MHEALIQQLVPFTGAVTSISAIGGGCIAQASRLEAVNGTFFLKWGDGDVAKTFAPEAAGLQALRETNTLKVPHLIASSSAVPGFLLTEWITQGKRPPGLDEALGEGLAQLHQSTAQRYGFAIDNFIGRTPQHNTWHDTWPAFFHERRLAPQVALARRQGRWSSDWDTYLDGLYKKLPDLLPATPPASLLHGDLWGGNYMVSAVGEPVLFDPACYYGDRETDLAMTTLFGGFNTVFYDAYAATWPLDAGYQERRPIYNLYHQINHLNLFGASYASGIVAVLRHFG